MQFEVKTYADFKAAVEELCALLRERAIPAERVFDSKLVVYELIGNVLQHAGCGATLTVEIDEEYVSVTVRGEKGYEPPAQAICPPRLAERGRGLYLVDALSAERVFTPAGDILVRIRIQ